MRYIKVLIFITILFTFSNSQTKYSPEQEKVRDYLEKHFESTYKDFSNLHDEFADFVPLKEDMEKELSVSFPAYRFFVAKTFFSHWGRRDNTSMILVVTNAKTGEVIGYRWALWYAGFSESFSHILESVTFSSESEAKAKVELFAKLLVSIGRGEGKVGKIDVKKNIITVDLDDNWRILKIPLKGNHFEQMAFINPKEKKETKEDKSDEKREKIKP